MMDISTKMQTDFIKGERIYFINCDDFIFITDGYVGAYIKEKDLKVSTAKMIEKNSADFIPQNLLSERSAAIETRIARKIPMGGYAIKLYSEATKEHCYVQEKYLELFKDCDFYIKSKRDAIIACKYGIPQGVLLPLFIHEQEGE